MRKSPRQDSTPSKRVRKPRCRLLPPLNRHLAGRTRGTNGRALVFDPLLPEETAVTTRPRRVLLIDEDREFCAFLTMLLAAEGFETAAVHSLDAVRAELATRRPHLVIAEARLHGAPPFAILNLLDGPEQAEGLRVILCTGAVHELGAAGSRLTRPGLDVLVKPFEIEDLIDRVTRVCDADITPPCPAVAGRASESGTWARYRPSLVSRGE